MTDWQDILTAAAVGIGAGFITSALGGPINITVVNESAQRGFFRGLLIALGATAMELVYCAAAFAGFAELFQRPLVRAIMELFSFLLVLWLGIKYLRAGHLEVGPKLERLEHLVEERLHPHTAFWTGFVRVLANPGVLLLWIAITGSLVAHRVLQPTLAGKLMFCAGVATAGCTWFTGLSWGVSRGHGRFSVPTLRRISQASGLLLLITAGLIASRLIVALASARH
ncbi:MAG: LysE family transporter [Verrucomicrobia bacterium]|nr:LysE family transporter [Verrucomicrobiota bacterium]